MTTWHDLSADSDGRPMPGHAWTQPQEQHPGDIGGDTFAFDITITNTSPAWWAGADHLRLPVQVFRVARPGQPHRRQAVLCPAGGKCIIAEVLNP
jgi:hypothetical protein